MNLNIIHEKEFKGLPVYSNVKANYGFYEFILERIYSLFQISKSTFDQPKVCHLLIDDPIDGIGKKIGRLLKRWSNSRHKLKGSNKVSEVYFLLVKEVRPRTGQQHAHVAVFFDGLNWRDLLVLEEKSQSLSKTNSARVYKRDKKRMPLSVNQETGEIHMDENGEPRRKTSSFYHDINSHLEDAFERISYLAKVYSKSHSESRVSVSSSRTSHLRSTQDASIEK